MKRTLAKQLPTMVGQTVQIAGFAQVVRDQKRMQFVVLRDHTGMVQLFHEREGMMMLSRQPFTRLRKSQHLSRPVRLWQIRALSSEGSK